MRTIRWDLPRDESTVCNQSCSKTNDTHRNTTTDHTSEFFKMSCWMPYVNYWWCSIVGATAVGLGFETARIVAGTPAARMMSTLAPTIAGGVVATLQSVGTGAAVLSTIIM